MEKEFCTYEQSLALRELGFNEPSFGYYIRNKRLIIEDGIIYINDLLEPSAPLIQQAFRFFREKYGLYFIIEQEPGAFLFECTIRSTNDYFIKNRAGYYKTYEEAQQACLDKLIELETVQHKKQKYIALTDLMKADESDGLYDLDI